MANGNLIQGARRIGQARGFVDYGKILGENIKTPALTKFFEEARAQYFQNIKEKEAKLAGFINQKAYMDTSKINEYNVDMATEFLTGKRTEYINAANIAATSAVGSEEYVNAVSTMNSVNNSIKNFDAELQAWRQLDTEQTLDFDKTKISKGNFNYGDIMETMQDPRSENGPSFKVAASGRVTMIIKDAEGKVIKELKRQEYFLKADEKMDQLSKLSDAFKTMGSNNMLYDENLANNKMQIWLNEDHTKLLSLARDSFLGVPAMIKDEDLEKVIYGELTGRELLQKDNQAQLKNFLAEKYGNVLRERYDAGKADYTNIQNEAERKRREKEQEGELAILNNIQSIIDQNTVSTGITGGMGPVDTPGPLDYEVLDKQSKEKIVMGLKSTYSKSVSAYPFLEILTKKEAFENFYKNAQDNPELYTDNPQEIEAFSKNNVAGKKRAEEIFNKLFNNADMYVINKQGGISPYQGNLRDPKEIALFLSNKGLITGKQIETQQTIAQGELD